MWIRVVGMGLAFAIHSKMIPTRFSSDQCCTSRDTLCALSVLRKEHKCLQWEKWSHEAAYVFLKGRCGSLNYPVEF